MPDLDATRGKQAVVLDVQVMSTLSPLSQLHATKTAKYDFLSQLENERPLVSSATLNYSGVWAAESARSLRDLGLGRRDFKTLTIRCQQGGHHGFLTHQRMTTAFGS